MSVTEAQDTDQAQRDERDERDGKHFTLNPNLAYQSTVRGRGFNGPGQDFPAQAVRNGRQKARELNLEGPFHFQGHPATQLKRSEMFEKVTQKLRRASPQDDPIVVLSKHYDDPGLAFRAIKKLDTMAKSIEIGKEFESPCCSYLMGYEPSKPCPTRGDCSGFVKHCLQAAYGISVPHSAAEIWTMNHPRLSHFSDPDNVKSGDIIGYYFGSERRPCDDVAMVYGPNKPGFQIGSRPSVKPGYSRDGVQIWRMDAPGEESNRLGFLRVQV